MKAIVAIFTMALILITLSSSQNIHDKNVNLSDLVNKDFKYIVKFDDKTTDEEINQTETFLKQYNSSINIKRSVNEINGRISLEINSKSVKCKSDNFGTGMVLLDKNYLCQCAIADKGVNLNSER